MDTIIELDKQLLVYLNNLGSERWDWLWLIITNQLYWAPLILFVLYLIFKTYGKKQGSIILFFIIVLVAFSDQLTVFLKNYTARLRPVNDPEINNDLRIIILRKSFSFISGHATTSTFSTVFIYQLLKKEYKYMVLLFIFPLVFSYSRVYLGLHFPTDVTVGACVGATLGALYFKFYKYFSLKYIR